jgi:hypothetical protein
MRVSVVNFCSTAIEMLKFSTGMIFDNAGTDDFDYYVVTWLPTPEVVTWIEYAGYPIIRIPFETQPGLDYVPQLRAMMNHGFDTGILANDWVVPVNTDMAFAKGWLANLVRRATEPGVIPNSLHITPTPAGDPSAQGVGIIYGNFGLPTADTFDLIGFERLAERLREDRVATQDEVPGGWRSCATFPYALHRSWWARYGPWALRHEGGDAPDRRFFAICADHGAKFLLCRDSIVYHHEAVERRGRRPPGAEHMAEGA